MIGRGSMGGETSNGAGEERRGREGRREEEKGEKENGRRERRGKERERRECKDRGNKRSTEMHQGKREQETGRTQFSFSVCGSRRGRTGVGTKRPRHTLAIKEARRSERAREQRLLRG